ncbi:MAG: FAD-dependent oxidoreductase [Bacteroidetes bacterium]|nr:FAD-dependent oxidoreductase [Bacteroidota bacterium]MCY4204139.1 FAD-dependent oxidoreductase [Bacteroidota bacterium]
MLTRRDFIQLSSGGLLTLPHFNREWETDIAIIGGGTGGCAAALAALRMNKRVILTEETDWIGGQFTQQGVPPDEHQWIESQGATDSYLKFRNQIRDYYRRFYPLTNRNAELLNPGTCGVSRLCHEPRVALSVLNDWMAPYLSSGQLKIFLNVRPTSAEVNGDRIRSVQISSMQGVIRAKYFIDATEDGLLLELSQTEYISGAEPDTGELHASTRPGPDNMQAPTWCFAMDYDPGADHTIDRPESYDYWRDYVPPIDPPWPGKLFSLTYTHPYTLEPTTASFDPRLGAETENFNLWVYRRLIDPGLFTSETYRGGISLVNWPQNDYINGNLFGNAESEFHRQAARDLSLSFFYWLQTEVPREDGEQGWPGLRLRGDLLGTADGLAKAPYLRESRRIHSEFIVTEHHIGEEARAGNPRAEQFNDSVGVGSYRIDLHPSTGGDNYIDVPSLPFEIPLGSLIPIRMDNLLPAAKNIGVTHITGGCYRLHPVEWNIGESAGILAAWCIAKSVSPRSVRANHLQDFQDDLVAQGIQLRWPESIY